MEGEVLLAEAQRSRAKRVPMWLRASPHFLGTDCMPVPSPWAHSVTGILARNGWRNGMWGPQSLFLIVIICLPARLRPSFGPGWGLCGQERYGCGGGSQHEINSLPLLSGMSIMC